MTSGDYLALLRGINVGGRNVIRMSDLKACFEGIGCGGPNAVSNAIGYAMHRGRSHLAVIHVYAETGNVIETHEHRGEFKDW